MQVHAASLVNKNINSQSPQELQVGVGGQPSLPALSTLPVFHAFSSLPMEKLLRVSLAWTFCVLPTPPCQSHQTSLPEPGLYPKRNEVGLEAESPQALFPLEKKVGVLGTRWRGPLWQ